MKNILKQLLLAIILVNLVTIISNAYNTKSDYNIDNNLYSITYDDGDQNTGLMTEFLNRVDNTNYGITNEPKIQFKNNSLRTDQYLSNNLGQVDYMVYDNWAWHTTTQQFCIPLLPYIPEAREYYANTPGTKFDSNVRICISYIPKVIRNLGARTGSSINYGAALTWDNYKKWIRSLNISKIVAKLKTHKDTVIKEDFANYIQEQYSSFLTDPDNKDNYFNFIFHNNCGSFFMPNVTFSQYRGILLSDSGSDSTSNMYKSNISKYNAKALQRGITNAWMRNLQGTVGQTFYPYGSSAPDINTSFSNYFISNLNHQPYIPNQEPFKIELNDNTINVSSNFNEVYSLQCSQNYNCFTQGLKKYAGNSEFNHNVEKCIAKMPTTKVRQRSFCEIKDDKQTKYTFTIQKSWFEKRDASYVKVLGASNLKDKVKIIRTAKQKEFYTRDNFGLIGKNSYKEKIDNILNKYKLTNEEKTKFPQNELSTKKLIKANLCNDNEQCIGINEKDIKQDNKGKHYIQNLAKYIKQMDKKHPSKQLYEVQFYYDCEEYKPLIVEEASFCVVPGDNYRFQIEPPNENTWNSILVDQKKDPFSVLIKAKANGSKYVRQGISFEIKKPLKHIVYKKPKDATERIKERDVTFGSRINLALKDIKLNDYQIETEYECTRPTGTCVPSVEGSCRDENLNHTQTNSIEVRQRTIEEAGKEIGSYSDTWRWRSVPISFGEVKANKYSPDRSEEIWNASAGMPHDETTFVDIGASLFTIEAQSPKSNMIKSTMDQSTWSYVHQFEDKDLRLIGFNRTYIDGQPSKCADGCENYGEQISPYLSANFEPISACSGTYRLEQSYCCRWESDGEGGRVCVADSCRAGSVTKNNRTKMEVKFDIMKVSVINNYISALSVNSASNVNVKLPYATDEFKNFNIMAKELGITSDKLEKGTFELVGMPEPGSICNHVTSCEREAEWNACVVNEVYKRYKNKEIYIKYTPPRYDLHITALNNPFLKNVTTQHLRYKLLDDRQIIFTRPEPKNDMYQGYNPGESALHGQLDWAPDFWIPRVSTDNNSSEWKYPDISNRATFKKYEVNRITSYKKDPSEYSKKLGANHYCNFKPIKSRIQGGAERDGNTTDRFVDKPYSTNARLDYVYKVKVEAKLQTCVKKRTYKDKDYCEEYKEYWDEEEGVAYGKVGIPGTVETLQNKLKAKDEVLKWVVSLKKVPNQYTSNDEGAFLFYTPAGITYPDYVQATHVPFTTVDYKWSFVKQPISNSADISNYDGRIYENNDGTGSMRITNVEMTPYCRVTISKTGQLKLQAAKTANKQPFKKEIESDADVSFDYPVENISNYQSIENQSTWASYKSKLKAGINPCQEMQDELNADLSHDLLQTGSLVGLNLSYLSERTPKIANHEMFGKIFINDEKESTTEAQVEMLDVCETNTVTKYCTGNCEKTFFYADLLNSGTSSTENTSFLPINENWDTYSKLPYAGYNGHYEVSSIKRNTGGYNLFYKEGIPVDPTNIVNGIRENNSATVQYKSILREGPEAGVRGLLDDSDKYDTESNYSQDKAGLNDIIIHTPVGISDVMISPQILRDHRIYAQQRSKGVDNPAGVIRLTPATKFKLQFVNQFESSGNISADGIDSATNDKGLNYKRGLIIDEAWIKERWVRLPVGVVSENGHDAGKYYPKGTAIPINGTQVHTYYIPVNEDETVYTNDNNGLQAWTVASNAPDDEGYPDRYSYDNYDRRDYKAKHTAYFHKGVEVVGRIGNFSWNYTTDPQWQNYFRYAKAGGIDILKGFVKEPLMDKQRYFIGGKYSMYEALDKTYSDGINKFKAIQIGNNPIYAKQNVVKGVLYNQECPTDLIRDPADNEPKTPKAIAETPIKIGYPIYFTFQSVGNYFHPNTRAYITPEYYIIDKPVDNCKVSTGGDGVDRFINFNEKAEDKLKLFALGQGQVYERIDNQFHKDFMWITKVEDQNYNLKGDKEYSTDYQGKPKRYDIKYGSNWFAMMAFNQLGTGIAQEGYGQRWYGMVKLPSSVKFVPDHPRNKAKKDDSGYIHGCTEDDVSKCALTDEDLKDKLILVKIRINELGPIWSLSMSTTNSAIPDRSGQMIEFPADPNAAYGGHNRPRPTGKTFAKEKSELVCTSGIPTDKFENWEKIVNPCNVGDFLEVEPATSPYEGAVSNRGKAIFSMFKTFETSLPKTNLPFDFIDSKGNYKHVISDNRTANYYKNKPQFNPSIVPSRQKPPQVEAMSWSTMYTEKINTPNKTDVDSDRILGQEGYKDLSKVRTSRGRTIYPIRPGNVPEIKGANAQADNVVNQVSPITPIYVNKHDLIVGYQMQPVYPFVYAYALYNSNIPKDNPPSWQKPYDLINWLKTPPPSVKNDEYMPYIPPAPTEPMVPWEPTFPDTGVPPTGGNGFEKPPGTEENGAPPPPSVTVPPGELPPFKPPVVPEPKYPPTNIVITPPPDITIPPDYPINVPPPDYPGTPGIVFDPPERSNKDITIRGTW